MATLTGVKNCGLSSARHFANSPQRMPGTKFWEFRKYEQVLAAHWMFADLSDRIKGETLRLRNSTRNGIGD
jgi:hypothetical protein